MAQVELLKIFLASPSDVAEERDYVVEVIDEINRTIAPSRGVRLEVVRSEENVFPGYNPGGGQAELNAQIANMEEYALFVGIMWNRVGTSTPGAKSGTLEEFERAVEAFNRNRQPKIWFYFREAPSILKTEDEIKQRQKVVEFRQKLQPKALTGSYIDPSDFRNKFSSHIMLWLNAPENTTAQHECNVELSSKDKEILGNIPKAFQALPVVTAISQSSPFEDASLITPTDFLARVRSTLKEAEQLFKRRIRPNRIDVTETYEKVHELEESMYKLMELIDDNEQLSGSQSNLMSIQVSLEDPNEGIITYLRSIGTDLLSLLENPDDGKTIQRIRSDFIAVEQKFNKLKNLLG